LAWEKAAEPLDHFCSELRAAADHRGLQGVARPAGLPSSPGRIEANHRGLRRVLQTTYGLLPRNVRAGKNVQSLKHYVNLLLDKK
jgi:hypothetical protein